MELFIPALIFAALINKTVDWIRDWLPDHVEGKVLIPASMAVGVAYALLFAQSSFAESIDVTDTLTLAGLDVSGVIIFGMAAGALGSVLNDLKPNRLSSEQVERAVKQADTLVIETETDVPPIKATKATKKA